MKLIPTSLRSIRLFRRRGTLDNDNDNAHVQNPDENLDADPEPGLDYFEYDDDISDDKSGRRRHHQQQRGINGRNLPFGKKYKQFGGSVPAHAYYADQTIDGTDDNNLSSSQQYHQHHQQQQQQQQQPPSPHKSFDERITRRSHHRQQQPQSTGTSPTGGDASMASAASMRKHPHLHDHDHHRHHYHHQPTAHSAARLLQLPVGVLERIFAFVCPHSRDETYEAQEASCVPDACMLCDQRDLAHCLLVCRGWRRRGAGVLYHSVRIDAVHYCDREGVLAEKRKRRTFFDKNGDPEDTSVARLRLLCRTLRDDPTRLGVLVEYLKLPYMLREGSTADIARTISVLPNLRYVDLPEGLLAGDPAYLTLRMEVEAMCLNIRKMTYSAGSEGNLQHILDGRTFARLEVLDLVGIKIDPAILLQILSMLGGLRAVKVTDSDVVSDEMLAHQMPGVPMFPALDELILDQVPLVTAFGLGTYLGRPEVSQRLKILTLDNTGVRPWHLHEVMAAGTGLVKLSIKETASKSLSVASGGAQVPVLASTSLQTLHFEIKSSTSSSPYAHIIASYYQYLSSSLLAGGLSNLRTLYVRDNDFPETLVSLASPSPSFGRPVAHQRPSSSGSPGAPSFSASSSVGMLSPTGYLSPTYVPGYGNGASSPQTLSPAMSSSGTYNGGSMTNPRFSSNNPFASMVSSPTFAAGSATLPSLVSQQQHQVHNPHPPPKLPTRLEIFTKGDDDLHWATMIISPHQQSSLRQPNGTTSNSSSHDDNKNNNNNNDSASRPGSSYGIDTANQGWSANAGARKSVLVGDPGGGGFLAIPNGSGERARRGSTGASTKGSGGGRGVGGGGRGGNTEEWPSFVTDGDTGAKRASRMDLWR